jgi:N-acetylneuraminate synthase
MKKLISDNLFIEAKMKSFITIDGRKIGPDFPPYIIAELSANHNGDINRAFQIMEEAKKAGADAIKLQTYTHETITMDSDSEEFQIHGGLWDGQTLYELYKGAHMPWEWHQPLFEKAKELGITIFSSPFDFTAVDLLEELDAPAYKIASFEVIDLPLIKRVAQTGKPMIISTGMANEEEIAEAIKTAKDNGCQELVVLHCVSGYPAPADQYNLRTIADIAQRFDVLSGLSDHTIDNATAVTSVALGACLIEKHVTMDRNGGGADDSFSLEPPELQALCQDTKTAWQALGKVNYERTEAEKGNVKFRRSLYVVKDIKAGEELTADNVRSIRPGFGLAPKHYEAVLGQKATEDIKKGTALKLTMVSDC